MVSRKCTPLLIKKISVIISASITLLMMEWAVYSMFDEIGSFERNMRAELEEFEVFFNLSSKFFEEELSQRARKPRAVARASVKKGSVSSYSAYSGYAASNYAAVPSYVISECPEGGPGGRGYDGEPGTHGIPGRDGVPGLDGNQIYKDAYHTCVLCPAGPRGVPGTAGAEGPRGPPGGAGELGAAPNAYPVAGTPGPPGDAGKAGRDGDPGSPGAPGSPGRTCLAGLAGRPGPPGPRGPAGASGETKTRAERGPPGPRGVPGMEGRRGREGTNGLNGDAGERGPKGPDGLYCACPNRPPLEHYFTTTTPPPPVTDPSYVQPPAVPFADPIKVHTLTTRSAVDDNFPQPPPFSMISIEGASLGPPNEIVEDISMEVTPPSGGWASIKWSDMVAKRKRQWEQRMEVDSDDSALVIKRHLSPSTSMPRRRPPLIETYDTERGETEVLLDHDWIVLNPRRLARLRLGAVRGSLRGVDNEVGEYARPPRQNQPEETIVEVE